jgi:TP901 family phage tail tape measure protein
VPGQDRTVTVTVMARVSQFVAAMASAGATVRTLGAELDKATNTEKGRASLDKAARAAAGFGTVMLGVAAGAVALSAQFDAAMSKVKSNVDDKSVPAMKRLRDAAIQAGKDTQYSATEAADAEDELAKAGISAKDIYGGALTGALSLAAAGQLGVGDAAEIAASAMNNFQLTGQNIPHVADLLAAGADKAQGSVQDLGDALKYVGPVAGQMGISLESTVGVLTEMASQGIKGSQAGTSLRGVLSALTSPSQQAAGVMRQLGIEMYDGRGKFIGLSGAAGQLHDHMANLTDAQRDQALGMIFGNEQITAARVLYGGGAAGVDKFTKMINEDGFAVQSAGTKMDNLNGDLKKLKSSLETGLIEAGSGANSVLRTMTQALTGLVNGLGTLPRGVQQAGVWITGITGLLALSGAGFVKARTGIASLQEQLSAMGPAGEKAATGVGKVTGALGKIGLVGGIAAAVLAGLVLGANALAGVVDAKLPSVDKLAASLRSLANAAVLSGDAAKVLGPNFETLRADMDRIGPTASGTNKALASMDGTIMGLFGHIGVHSLTAATLLSTPFLSFLGPADQAKTRISQVDKALTELVTSGHADVAQQALVNMAARAGVGVDELTAKFPNLSKALDTANAAADSSVGPMHDLTAAFGGNALSAQAAADAVSNFVADLHSLNDPALGEFEATTKFQGSLIDLKKELSETGFSLDGASDKGQAFRAAIAQAVQSAKDLTDAEAKLKPGTDAASKALDNTRASLIALLTPYLGSKQAAQAFIDTVLKVPPSKATNISAPGAVSSKADVDAFGNSVNNLPTYHEVDILTFYKTRGTPSDPYAAQGTQKGGLGDLLGENRWGGITMHAAASGLLRQATLAPAGSGPLYQWAEKATGGEGFVPRFGDAARSRSIIDTEAGWYGGTVMWSTGSAVPYASVSPSGAGGGGGQSVVQGLAPVLMAMVAAIEGGRTISVMVGHQELVRAVDEGKRVTNWVG